MKTLKEYIGEGILAGRETIKSNIEKNITDVLNIPKIKDFKQTYKGVYTLVWDCPMLFNKYKKLYPNLIEDKYTCFQFEIDNYIYRNPQLHIKLAVNNTPGSSSTILPGWDEGFCGANMNIYKSMVLNFIEKLANNQKLFDDIMEYSNKYEQHRKTHNVITHDVVKFPIKQLLIFAHKYK